MTKGSKKNTKSNVSKKSVPSRSVNKTDSISKQASLNKNSSVLDEKPKKSSKESAVSKKMSSKTTGRKAAKATTKTSKKTAKTMAKASSSVKKSPNKKETAKNKVPTVRAAGKKKTVKEEKPTAKAKGKAVEKLDPRSSLARAKGIQEEVAATGSDSVCREVACEGLGTSGGYCRLHYIKNWKKIKRKEIILKEKKLNRYIEELVAKYPEKYIEAIRQDLASDKDFAKVILDLDLDENVDDFDVENADSVDSLIDSIKRDFEDEGDSY